MAVRLLLAPAAAGKTAYVLGLARDAARNLQAIPRVVVPTHLQVRAWRRRLAEAGGAIGVRVLTFDRLYAECLNAAGEAYTELSEPVQYRLIRSVVDDVGLEHYAPLVGRPGFVQILERLIGELKAARVHPEAFARAVDRMESEPRLRELADVYAAYQTRLQAQGWADRPGLGWLAVEALEERAPDIARDWPLLVVDGFDHFTEVQLALLTVLAGRVGEMMITLTGDTDGGERRPVHRRFAETCERCETALGVQARPLPRRTTPQTPALAHLEVGLFRGSAAQVDAAGAVELVEAPDRAAEVRAALRWLKACLVQDGLHPGDVALLARNVTPYRPFILQIAAEFGLPVRLLDGLPLRKNPAVTALVDLLRLMLPPGEGDAEPGLPRRLVVEAWRSPYFDWSALPKEGAANPIGIGDGDADLLDAVARWGLVIGGHGQWREVLDSLAAREEDAAQRAEGEADQDEERGLPAGIPSAAAAQALRDKFDRFVQRLRPPAGKRSYREFVQWLEALIGPDPAVQSSRFPLPKEPTALQVVRRAREGPQETRERDVAALQSLKDVLRGLVWAEEALSTGQAMDLSRFFEELVGAVDAAHYQMPVHPERKEIVVADVIQARGVPYRAVAVLGLAEGEFPATLSEDPFLRDADRRRLREEFRLELEPSTESAEVEFFYETVTRPWERLLLTRPRLAENGALWQASPFWEEVRRLVRAEAATLTSESLPTPSRVASWPELMESLATRPGYHAGRQWAAQADPERGAALDLAARLFDLRRRRAASPFDGDLSALAREFNRRLGPDHVWSASRLEAYRACPYRFFVGKVLGLEPCPEPAEGLDARQLGNIYHHILEQVYEDPRIHDPADLEQLLAVLPDVAAAVLDAAPQREGFRETAWWTQTRDEILGNVRRSLKALAALPGDFRPLQHEAAFGRDGWPPLVVREGEDRFLLCGYIDRVDRAPGGQVRVIDYKTAGPWSYDRKAIADGKKLQLPLYALAAREALELGDPVEGFYWHVRHAEHSDFTLRRFQGGPEGAMDVAVEKAWEAVRGARDGHFAPQPADGDCPAYCPAVSFCWHYHPGFRG
jgi:ATP-dependent helicase/nuclease subunit B